MKYFGTESARWFKNWFSPKSRRTVTRKTYNLAIEELEHRDVPTVLAAPALLSPAGSMASLSPTFTWSAATGADHYDIWVNDLTSGQAPVLRNASVTGTSATFSQELTPGDNYRFWVRDFDSAGHASAWSAALDFTTAALAVPTVVSPTGSNNNATPTFSWTTAAGADHYDVWVSDLTTGQSPVLRNASATGTSLTFSQGLHSGHSYAVWVRDFDNAGHASGWSNGLTFAVAATPTPVLTGPTGSGNSARPTFTWSTVSGADHYGVWVSDLTTGQSPVLQNANVAGTSITFDQDLRAGHNYRFWVQAVNALGDASAWSKALDFGVAPLGTPVPNGPAGGDHSETVTFTWSAVDGADHYQVWADNLTTGQSQVEWNPNATGTSWTVSSLDLGTSYRWWVRAINGAGDASTWSNAQDFAVMHGVDPWAGFDDFVNSMNDAGLADSVRNWTLDDGQLSRTDVLNLLAQEESYGSVSGGQLADLQAIANNGVLLHMPDDVAQLLGKVVGDNVANQTYKGAALGDLQPDSDATQLADLVDKWFLGGDLPATSATYVYAHGNLYGASGQPQYSDVAQGWSADCYFLASLADIAYQSPDVLQSHISDNGDGTFTIRFDMAGNNTAPVWDYVTVNRMLPGSVPTDADGNPTGDPVFVYANTGQNMNNDSNVLWVALYEKAYAQLAEEGWSRGAGRTNAYTSIDYGDPAYVMNQVAGVNTQGLDINADGVYDLVTQGPAAGRWIAPCTPGDEPDPNIVGGHAYAVLSYDADTQLLTIYNPWGFAQQISWNDFHNDFNYVASTV